MKMFAGQCTKTGKTQIHLGSERWEQPRTSTGLATSCRNGRWAAGRHGPESGEWTESRDSATRSRRAQRIPQLHHLLMARLSTLALKSTFNPLSLFKWFPLTSEQSYLFMCPFPLPVSQLSSFFHFSFHTSFPYIRLVLCELDVHSQSFFSPVSFSWCACSTHSVSVS